MGDFEQNERGGKIFISRAGAEAAFAVQVAEALRGAGAETVLQDEDFGHQNFVAAMHEGLKDSATKVLALISPEWLASDACQAEGLAALGGDTLNRQERLIPVLVAPSSPDGLFTAIAYTSVVRERQLGETAAAIAKILAACGYGAPIRSEEKRRTQILHSTITRNEHFIGRAAEFQALERALTAGETVAITALQGEGGVGKTSLAREYAWRHRERYHGVWWISATSPDALREGLIELGAKEMPDLATSNDRAAAAERALRWIESCGSALPWLLILDNVEDPAHLRELLPRENAHLLITSHRTDWRGTAEALSLDMLPLEDAVEFLCTTAAREDREGAAALAEALGRLPLALEQAASYCHQVRTVSFAEYQAKMAAYLAKAPFEAGKESVAATFELAIERLQAERPEAVRLLELMGFCAPSAIPLDLFVTEARDLAKVGEQAADLARYSIIRQRDLDDGAPGVDVHRLVQLAARSRAGAGRLEEMLALLSAAIPSGEGENDPPDHRSWPRLERLEPHGLAALAHLPEQIEGDAAEHAGFIANVLGFFANAQARYGSAEPLYRRALAIREAALGAAHPDVAQSLNNLAEQLQSRGALEEAEPLYRRSLAIWEAALGAEHPDVAASLNNLAALLRERGALEEAEPLYRRALAIWEAALGSEHPDVAASLNNLAELLQACGALEEAEPLYRRALVIDQAALGAEHPDVATDLNNLAGLLHARGALEEAEQLLRRALAIDEAALGAEHPNVASALNNLAALLQDRGALEEAESVYRRALAILEAKLPEAHPWVQQGRANLARLEDEVAAQRRKAEAPRLAPVAEAPPADLPPQAPPPETAPPPAPAVEAAAPQPNKRRSFWDRLLGRNKTS